MWALAHACATPPSRVTEPPAFSIASTADLDAPATWKESFVLSSPTPRIFTPSRGLETTPAATSVSTVTAAPVSSLPASTADAHAVLGGTFVVTNFVEFHDALLTARRQRARGA